MTTTQSDFHKYFLRVRLYIRGKNLDPNLVTQVFGLGPTNSQRAGEMKKSAKGGHYISKIGVWVLDAESDSDILADHVDSLLSKLKSIDNDAIFSIPFVEDAYVDIFIAGDIDQHGSGGCDFKLSDVLVSRLSRLRLPLHFSLRFDTP